LIVYLYVVKIKLNLRFKWKFCFSTVFDNFTIFSILSYKPAVDNNTNRLLESDRKTISYSSLLLELNWIVYCVRQRLVKLIKLNNNGNYNNDWFAPNNYIKAILCTQTWINILVIRLNDIQFKMWSLFSLRMTS
jgi:hypothetical protein